MTESEWITGRTFVRSGGNSDLLFFYIKILKLRVKHEEMIFRDKILMHY